MSFDFSRFICLTVDLICTAISASIHSNSELSTDEMRRLLERNEVVNPHGGNSGGNLQPFNTMNI